MKTIALNALGVAIILIFIWGLVGVVRFLYQLLAAPIASHAAPLLAFLVTVFGNHLDGWVTGIATCVLAYFTFTLRAEAKRQGEKDRPFLAIEMRQSADDGDWNEYVWHDEDAEHATLMELQAGYPPLFVSMKITNEQPTVTGMASNVEVDLVLYYGVVDDASSYPYVVYRKVYSPAVSANKYVEGNIFNVAGLRNYTIRVTGLSYKDISGKTRRFGYGVGNIYKRTDQDPSYTVMVFDSEGGTK